MSRKKYAEDYVELDDIKVNKLTKNKHRKYGYFIENRKKILVISSVLIIGTSLFFSIKSKNVIEVDSKIIDNNKTDIEMIYSQEGNMTISINQNSSSIETEIMNNTIEEYLDSSKDTLVSTLEHQYQNADIKLYLSFYDNESKINYAIPVSQTHNNSYYLDHNLNKEFSKTGSAFIDYRIETEQTPKNLVIYGNDQFESSPLFFIKKFLDKEFYENNKLIKIEAKDNSLYYEIFAFSVLKENFKIEPIDFNTLENFSDYLDKIEEKSLYYDNVEKTDNIITIATSSNKVNEERYILYGKLKQHLE